MIMEIYREALAQYLRRGVPVRVSIKEALHPTTHYVWRARGDGKVRASHAANNGKIFAWNDPPATGHPGEDWGCRCWAEPYYEEVNESVSQLVTSIVDEGLERWEWYDFVNHFFMGGGKPIRLSDVGHLQDVIDVSRGHVLKGVERQVFKDARTRVSGILNDTFKNTYPYYSVSFIHGESTVWGNYKGLVTLIGNALHIDVEVVYNFSDVFTDPFDVRELSTGSSDPRAIAADELIDGEFGGKFYGIYDSWTTHLSAVIHRNSSKSIYRGD
jgi:hypothetical protein